MNLTLEQIKSTYFVESIKYLSSSWGWGYSKGPKLDALVLDVDDTPETRKIVFRALESDIKELTRWTGTVDELYSKEDLIPVSDKLAEMILSCEIAKQALSDAEIEFDKALSKAMKIADEHNLDFTLDTAYGMGGTYYGSTQEWYPSSQNC